MIKFSQAAEGAAELQLCASEPVSKRKKGARISRNNVCRVGIGGMAVCVSLASGAAPLPAPDPTSDGSVMVPMFNAGFLGISAQSIDVARFSRPNMVPPGHYLVDVYVNQYRVGRENVSFVATAVDGEVRPCVTASSLEAMGVDTGKLISAGASLDGDCLDIAAIIPDASSSFDTGALRLDYSVPQIAMSRHARGYVPPSAWDRGANAFSLGYNVSANSVDRIHKRDSLSAYAGLQAGLNLGGWRIRNQSNYQWSNGGGSRFQNINTYAQHDITALQSQFTVGDTFTSGALFDSTAFRGFQLSTDQRMRPDSLNGYAPIIRGAAETNARVIVRQGDFVLYEADVAPGKFEVNDLPATGYGGDLEVVVIEADGRENRFKVPFAAVPQLLRPGISNYAATLGKVRDDSLLGRSPSFVEATYQRGLNNSLTGYGGLQATDGGLYQGLLLGAAFNTPFGAVSADISHSRASFHEAGGPVNGNSVRVTYSKNIPETHTNFALAAYRYSSRGYTGLREAVQQNDALQAGQMSDEFVESAAATRNRLQLTVNQHLGSAGSMYASASHSDYWDKGRKVDSSYQLGWNNRYRDLQYGLSYQRSRRSDDQYENMYYFNVSVPLGRSSNRAGTPQFNLAGTRDDHGQSVRAGVAGTAGDRRQVNYGVSGRFNDQNTDSLSANVGWRTPAVALGAAYTHGAAAHSASVSASGGLVVHPGGVTLAQYLGDTIAVLHAHGAKGARLATDNVSRIDGRGYAIVSSLTPYRRNDVWLDPKSMAQNVELSGSQVQVVPRAGAVLLVEFPTISGQSHLLRVKLDSGEIAPFGAEILSAGGERIGFVGQGGFAYVRIADDEGPMRLQFSSGRECPLNVQPRGESKSGMGEALCSSNTSVTAK
ncbi:fimbria/pilus outer membrane usher protein [Lysobacter sp. FW306-1B-D06B]|uniref:fimbria/pilus outer membrane usher protein n=1 Tax=Lysobacter sp. FW306-1B-D06B TaxID=3140250 RepID=UPI0031401641